MEKLKSNLTDMVCVLGGVAVLCGGLLAFVNNLTAPAIKSAEDRALAKGITKVMGAKKVNVENPKGDNVTRNIGGKDITYTIYKTDKGTAVKAIDPNAFSGNLAILVGFNENGDITGYSVLENNETPGLGAKCIDWFQKGNPGNIIGMNPGKDNMTVSKDGGDVDAITASTITSRAFLNAVQEAYNAYNNTETDGMTSASKQAK